LMKAYNFIIFWRIKIIICFSYHIAILTCIVN